MDTSVARSAAVGGAPSTTPQLGGPRSHSEDGLVLVAVLLCTLLRGARLYESKVFVNTPRCCTHFLRLF